MGWGVNDALPTNYRLSHWLDEHIVELMVATGAFNIPLRISSAISFHHFRERFLQIVSTSIQFQAQTSQNRLAARRVVSRVVQPGKEAISSFRLKGVWPATTIFIGFAPEETSKVGNWNSIVKIAVRIFDPASSFVTICQQAIAILIN